jgi:hypothetical protein
MSAFKDPFEALEVEVVETDDEFASLARRPVADRQTPALPAAATARLHGFDLHEQPLVSGLRQLPGEVVPARTTVPLTRRQIGAPVVLVFEEGDIRRPIVLGVVHEAAAAAPAAGDREPVSVRADDERLVLSAEREVVLRCGDASITLTRAGKVLIKGRYVLSRSSGYNRIKGAAVDIN